jgi:hypothetical protein
MGEVELPMTVAPPGIVHVGCDGHPTNVPATTALVWAAVHAT